MSQSNAIAASPSRLLALPAELREYIYSLAFSSTAAERANFFELRPPDKSLLLTCRQVYSEARNVHRAAHRHYWADTDFVMDFGIRPDNEEEWMNAVNTYSEDIGHIRSLRVTLALATVVTLIDKRGGWKAQREDWQLCFRFMRWTHRGEVDPARLAWTRETNEVYLREACALHPCGVPLSKQILWLPTVNDLLNRY